MRCNDAQDAQPHGHCALTAVVQERGRKQVAVIDTGIEEPLHHLDSVTLVPRSDAGYKSMTVWIDGMDSLVRRFQITESTGALVEFQLSNLSVNPVLGNEIFQFSPPAGAKVIER